MDDDTLSPPRHMAEAMEYLDEFMRVWRKYSYDDFSGVDYGIRAAEYLRTHWADYPCPWGPHHPNHA